MASFSGSGKQVSATVTIANGESLSDAAELLSLTLIGILIPAAWTSAGLTFQASADGTTYGNLVESSGEINIGTLAAGAFVSLDPAKFLAARYIKVRSGTSGTPVNQGAARSVVLFGLQL